MLLIAQRHPVPAVQPALDSRRDAVRHQPDDDERRQQQRDQCRGRRRTGSRPASAPATAAGWSPTAPAMTLVAPPTTTVMKAGATNCWPMKGMIEVVGASSAPLKPGKSGAEAEGQHVDTVGVDAERARHGGVLHRRARLKADGRCGCRATTAQRSATIAMRDQREPVDRERILADGERCRRGSGSTA